MSSDLACVGESYQGASVYYCDYTDEFEPVELYVKSAMPDNESVRLYEVKEEDGKLYFLFARNFLIDCDFLLRAMAVSYTHLKRSGICRSRPVLKVVFP